MRAQAGRRVMELQPEKFNDRWLRILQIETATEADATLALMEAINKGWRDRMGGVCRTGHKETPFGVVLEKDYQGQDSNDPRWKSR